MALNEACLLWIEQRLDEELEQRQDKEKSLRQIGREIAAEVERLFEAKATPGAISKRFERTLKTNVAQQESPLKPAPSGNLEKLEKTWGGPRPGSGRKPEHGKQGIAHVSYNTGQNEWYTPVSLVESARSVMGSIDTDPASSEIANNIIKASLFYTKETDGLDKKWEGNVWMNPPYSQPLISLFSDAVTDKFKKGEIKQAIVLVNNATETRWFRKMASESSMICFIGGRVRFIDMEGNPGGAPLQGQAVLYMGENEDEFLSEFSTHGFVVEVLR